MKRNKFKILLSLYLALCIVFNFVMFSYITAFASTGSGMTQEEIDRANGLYGSGNWSYDSENDVVVPTEDAQKNLGDFLLSGFGIARKTVSDGFDWCKTHMQDIINKHFDDIAIKNDLLYIPKECVDELHDSLKDDANITKLQGYYLLESNLSKNDVKGAYLSNYYPESVSVYQSFVDEYSNYNMYVSDVRLSTTYDSITVVLIPTDNVYLYVSSYASGSQGVNLPFNISILDSELNSFKFKYIRMYHNRGSSSIEGVLDYMSSFVSPNNSDFYGYCGQPLKIFYTLSDLQIYLNQLKGIGSQKIYISQKFYDYQSSDLNINVNTYQSTNWTTQNQNIYNDIVNNRNETLVNNEVDVLTDVDLQTIIDTTIQKYIFQSGGGSGDGGGGSGDNPGSGGTLVIPDETQNLLEQIYSVLSTTLNWVKPIYDLVGDISTELENLKTELFVRTRSIIDELENIIEAINNLDFTGVGDSIVISDSIQELIDLLESKFSRLFEILESFDFGSDGKSIFDYLLEWLLNQVDHFGNFLDTLLGNLLADILMFFIGDGGLTDVVVIPATALASEAKSRFPTSIPWDIIAIVGIFSATPEIPYFELPFSIPKLGIDEKIVIDFEKAENLGKLSRSMFEVTFLLFLVIQTRKLYGSVNSN